MAAIPGIACAPTAAAPLRSRGVVTVALGGLLPTRTCVGVIWQVRPSWRSVALQGWRARPCASTPRLRASPSARTSGPIRLASTPISPIWSSAWPRAARAPWRSDARSATRALLELIGRCIATSPSGARRRCGASPTNGCRGLARRAQRFSDQNHLLLQSSWPGPRFGPSRRCRPMPRPTSLGSGRMPKWYCPPSALVGQFEGLHERRMTGSS